MALLQLNYFSNTLKKAQSAVVIHPDPGIEGPYHVMLLLHGLSDDHTIWQRRTSIERYVAGLPLIVAMPDGGRGFYCDAVEGYAMYTAVAEEFPDVIRHLFSPEGSWCTTGLSMGGYGAFRLALGRPELFRSAVSHSGAMLFGHSYPQPDWEDDYAPEFLRITGPITSAGGANDLLRLAKEARPLPALRFDCGTEDFLLDQNREFHRQLGNSGIEHEYEEFPGDHNWGYWDEHVQKAIAFHRHHLGF